MGVNKTKKKMATKLFLRNTTVFSGGTAGGYDLSTTAGSAIDTTVTNTTASGTQIQLTKTAGSTQTTWRTGYTPPAGFTLTSTDISLWQLESDMNANVGGRYRVFILRVGGSLSEVGGGPFNDGVEMNTSNREDTWVGNVTDTAFVENEQVSLIVYLTNVGTMGGGFTSTMSFNAAAAATGDSFFNLAETVTFLDSPFGLTQAAFRFYEDGTESGSVAIDTQDTNITRDVTADSNLQLRLREQNTFAVAGLTTDDYQLQYELNDSGTFRNIVEGAVASYYFNASTGGPTDPNAVWFSDANAFDGNTATSANTGVAGSTSSNYLFGAGTNGSASNTTTVSQVRARIYASGDDLGSSANAAVYTSGLGELLGTATKVATIAPGYGSYTTLSTPTGGWTWAKVAALETKIYADPLVGADQVNVARVDLEVTIASPVVGFNSSHLTEGEATTNRLGAGTGSFVAGKVSEDGTANDTQITASNFTEEMYSLTLVASELANGDTLDFRVLRNALTTGMTFTVTPRITVSKTAGGSTFSGYYAPEGFS